VSREELVGRGWAKATVRAAEESREATLKLTWAEKSQEALNWTPAAR
jgi:hypothetical protein